jgi:hypothetical protein
MIQAQLFGTSTVVIVCIISHIVRLPSSIPAAQILISWILRRKTFQAARPRCTHTTRVCTVSCESEPVVEAPFGADWEG